MNSQLTARPTRGPARLGGSRRPGREASREKSCERGALLEPTAVEAEAERRGGRKRR
jgi:hypothetical protein